MRMVWNVERKGSKTAKRRMISEYTRKIKKENVKNERIRNKSKRTQLLIRKREMCVVAKAVPRQPTSN